MTFTINKKHSKSTIKVSRNSAKTCPKLNDIANIVVVSLLSNLDRFHTNCNASSIYVQQKFVHRVDAQLIFKNVSGNKKVYTKFKSEKITEANTP